MTGRPVAALTESVARQIVREHNGNLDRIAVALAEEVIARGGWKASTCQPLLRAFELAAPSPASPAETREGLRERVEKQIEAALADVPKGYGSEYDGGRAVGLTQALNIVRAASPAVSLPGEAETPSRVVMLTPTGDRVVVLRGPDEDGLCGVEHLDRSGTSIQAFSSLRVAPSLPGEQPGGQEPRRRKRACVEAWPQCEEGAYDPACCRFPKSCSCTVYDPDRVTEADLDPAPALPGERADGEDRT